MLQVTLLGQVHVVNNNKHLQFETDATRALLAYLVMHPYTALSRKKLATLFWSELSAPKAYRNLRQTWMRLRRAFDNELADQYFISDRATLTFAPQGTFKLDLTEFDNWLNIAKDEKQIRRQTRLLEKATALYSEFLQDVWLDSQLFYEWVSGEREKRLQQLLNAQYKLGNHYETLGLFERMAQVAQQQLAIEAWREEAHEQLIRAFIYQGKRSAAVAQFENCQHILATELGIEPGATMQELYALAVSGQFVPQKLEQVVGFLPEQLTRFFGRSPEIDVIESTLLDDKHRLLTLTGMGGVGKTRLAIATAQRVRRYFADDVWFIPLTSLTSAQPEDISDAIARTLDIQLRPHKSSIIQVTEHLRDQEALLILDNFEHVLAGADIVIDLLQAAPNIAIICTSREALGFQAEAIIEVDGLPLPVDTERNNASIELFVARAQLLKPHYVYESAVIADIIRLVDGHPLGIELAAAMISRYSLTEIYAHIMQSVESLITHFRDIPLRHRSIRAVFDNSWVLLSAAEQQVFAKLSIFRGGFSAAAGLAIASATHIELTTFVQKSLLQSLGGDRYLVHELLREFSAEYVTDLPTLQRSYSTYFLNELAHYDTALESSMAGQIANTLSIDLDNIRFAWQLALQHQLTTLVSQSAGSLSNYFVLRGLYREAEMVFGQADTQLPPPQLALLNMHRTRFLTRLGRYAEVPQAAAIAARYADENDPRTLLTARISWAESLWRCGRYDEAMVQLDGTIEFAKKHNRPIGVGSLHFNYGVIHQFRGEFKEADQHLQAALQIWQTLGNERSFATTLNSLGRSAFYQYRLDEAEDYFRRAEAIQDSLGEKQGNILAMINLGIVATERGAYADAHNKLLEGRQLSEETDALTFVASCDRFLGKNALLAGDLPLADSYLHKGLAISERLQLKDITAEILLLLGRCAEVERAYDTALTFYQNAQQLSAEINHPYTLCQGHIGLATINRHQGNFERSRYHAQRAVEISNQINHAQFMQMAKNLI